MRTGKSACATNGCSLAGRKAGSVLVFLLFPGRLSKVGQFSSAAQPEVILDIETKSLDRVTIIKLKGRLSMGPSLDRFNTTITQLLGQGQNRLVLDLEDVPSIDSSGIGMLVRYLTTAKQNGGAIRLLKPSKFTVQTLRMVGLLNLFSTFDDSSEAVASFQ